MSTKKKPLTQHRGKRSLLLAIAFLVATISTMIIIGVAYSDSTTYPGEIEIATQEGYDIFIDKVFTDGVTVNILDIQPSGANFYEKGAWIADPPDDFPTIIGFSYTVQPGTDNPLRNLEGVRYYTTDMGYLLGAKHDRQAYTIIVMLLGGSASVALFIYSRYGLHEKEL